MLERRPNCECCDRTLAPDAADTRICTFCASGGELLPRPRRLALKRAQYPAPAGAASSPAIR